MSWLGLHIALLLSLLFCCSVLGDQLAQSPGAPTLLLESGHASKQTAAPLDTVDSAALRAKEAVVQEFDSYTTRGVSFDCSGSTCGATLYLPSSSSSKSSSKPPVVVMAHGLGGERVWLDKFAAPFARAGLAVFTFDYRHWGSSDGQPRQWVSIAKQHADWLSAVKHVQSNLGALVDVSKLALWGTSFAGGHVIVTASKLPGQIKAVISNVPHLDGSKATQANRAARGTRGNALVAMRAIADLAADSRGAAPVYIPLAGPKGSTAVMQLDEHDLEVYTAAHPHTESQWQNLVRARFATEQVLGQYSPIEFVSKVTSPLMIIAGTKDSLCPYAAAVEAAAKAPKGTLVSFPVGHFDPYVQPTLGQSIAKQLEFLKQHLA